MSKFEYIEIKMPAHLQFDSVVRLTISGLASRIGFNYDEIEDLKIAASEAMSSVVHQGYKDHEEDKIIIGCALYEDKMEIMMTDYKNSFNFKESKSKMGKNQTKGNVVKFPEAQLGIYLMETLMDEVMIHHDSSTTVFMTKYVTKEQVEKNVERITT